MSSSSGPSYPKTTPGCCTDCCPCTTDGSGSGGFDSSNYPIRYANGEMEFSVDDLSSVGFGINWGHTRSFSNRFYSGSHAINGNGWYVAQLPVLVPDEDGSVGFVRQPQKAVWFSSSGGVYSPLFPIVKAQMSQAAEEGDYTVFDQNGAKTVFYGASAGVYLENRFKAYVDPANNTYTATYNTSKQLESFVMTSGDASAGYYYTYYSTYSGSEAAFNQIETVTYKVTGFPVRSVTYTYYASGDESGNGNVGDLKTAVVTGYDPSTLDPFTISNSYYRYYTPADEVPFHGLRYAIGPEAYARMVADGHTDPTSVANSVLDGYADYCFEYDDEARVTSETVNGGACNSTFTYTQSSNDIGYNSWAVKTIETLPDGSENIIFTNFAGQVMLKVFNPPDSGESSEDKQWFLFFSYDDNGNGIMRAESSAVESYDETNSSLITLKTTSGLVHTFDYYVFSGSGAVPGYLAEEGIRQGQFGTLTKLRDLQYVTQTVGGNSLVRVSKQTVYQSSASGGSAGAETDLSYLWLGTTTTFRITQITTTLPVVSSSDQNGSGSANTRIVFYDDFGRRQWAKDENGVITYTNYDVATGGLLQQIDDFDTSTPDQPMPPSGFPSSSGLNLITDFQVDSLGRKVQKLGPIHDIDLSGSSPTSIRRAEWTVYRDDIEQVWVGNGYGVGTGYSTFTLINPVKITQLDQAGRVTDEKEAIRTGDLSTSEDSGELRPTDEFPQTSWTRWTHIDYDNKSLLIAKKVYFAIPSSGNGTSGTNYNETDFGYDIMLRRNRVETPGGTITRTLYYPMGWNFQTWVGTNDTGATGNDPTGGGASGNNMVLVVQREYDLGNAGGNGNLTFLQFLLDEGSNRVTLYDYDFRNRRISATSESLFAAEYIYDNLDRLIQIDRLTALSGGRLIGRRMINFDPLGRVYQRVRVAVDPGTGDTGNSLTTNYWYDPAGNLIKQLNAGSGTFQKMIFDGVHRLKLSYTGYDTSASGYPYPIDSSDDTIMEQTEFAIDDGGNLYSITSRNRFHNATGTGYLTTPTGSSGQARVSYLAFWPDPLGRVAASANYGTYGALTWSYPGVAPSRSDSVLVTTNDFNDRGELSTTTDPQGVNTQFTYDEAGRRTVLVENYGSSPSRETDYTYNADSRLATLTAKNSTTGDQTTQWVYGVTTSGTNASAVASNGLLYQKIYPDDTSMAHDRETYVYNRVGDITQLIDPNNTTHGYLYDDLGRLQHDCVTLPSGSSVDGAVLRITRAYEARGMLSGITSYNNASTTSGTVVNDVQLTYNSFGQLATDSQSHSGAVESGTTPEVQYGYANGSTNTVRPTSITYPDGRSLAYLYSSSGSMPDVLSRIDSIVDLGIDSESDTTLAQYSYLGMGVIVEADYEEPDIEMTFIKQTGESNGDAGDQYIGLDRFYRLVDSRWLKSTTDIDRFQFDYYRASNRKWRHNTVATGGQDEFYTYDGLYQLGDLQRGSLNTGKTGISGTPTWEEEFTYDPTGNWSNYLTNTNGASDLDQDRTHTKANEIATIASSSLLVGFDVTGNMTKAPEPGNWSSAYTLTYDAWNRLVKVMSGSSTVATYGYDGLSRRTGKAADSKTIEFYYSSAWQILEERGDDPDPESTEASGYKQFVWGLRATDDLILRDWIGDETPRLYALRDGMHVTSITDVSGSIVERYGYDAFGTTNVMTPSFGLESPPSSYDWETTFCSYRSDYETGFFQVRNRYLHQGLGRWLSRDPLGILGGDVNLYGYAKNNPVTLIDPKGLDSSPFNVPTFGLPSAPKRGDRDDLTKILLPDPCLCDPKEPDDQGPDPKQTDPKQTDPKQTDPKQTDPKDPGKHVPHKGGGGTIPGSNGGFTLYGGLSGTASGFLGITGTAGVYGSTDGTTGQFTSFGATANPELSAGGTIGFVMGGSDSLSGLFSNGSVGIGMVSISIFSGDDGSLAGAAVTIGPGLLRASATGSVTNTTLTPFQDISDDPTDGEGMIEGDAITPTKYDTWLPPKH